MSYDIVPESAPFSPEQRAWLNGFLAGVLGSLDAQNAEGIEITRGGSAVSLAAAAAMLPPLSGSSGQSLETEEDFPWHDSTLAITERMSLAEGKPLERRMMAAMAQLDCGSCGYLCKTYAEALASGKEKSLTLCTPGGSETAKMLRALHKQQGAQTGQPLSESKAKSEEPAPGSRENPVIVQLISSERLNAAGSAKDTRHVTIDLRGTGLRYHVGDALGVLPTNCDQLISKVCEAAQIDGQSVVLCGGTRRTLAEVLGERCLRAITSELCDRACERIRQAPTKNGDAIAGEKLLCRIDAFRDADAFDEYDVLEFLLEFSPLGLTPQDLVDTLKPLRPRLYSIASSQCIHPHEVHLTVGRVENEVRGRFRKGVASTMFADRLLPGASFKVFVQSNHGFTVPVDPRAPIIMVGPGTGIAPFIAFLQQREFERRTRSDCGRNWLFFGDQKRASDFLYEQQLTAWLNSGLLSRLDLAFSRDAQEKVYVQNRMREHGAELYRWLESGSYFYVCGDARRMARDVEQALLEIAVAHGGHSPPAAKDFLKSLKSSGRYATDVY